MPELSRYKLKKLFNDEDVRLTYSKILGMNKESRYSYYNELVREVGLPKPKLNMCLSKLIEAEIIRTGITEGQYSPMFINNKTGKVIQRSKYFWMRNFSIKNNKSRKLFDKWLEDQNV